MGTVYLDLGAENALYDVIESVKKETEIEMTLSMAVRYLYNAWGKDGN